MATVTREINGKVRTYEQKIATTPSGLDQIERVSNARLIAAAPDMLEALRKALPYVFGTAAHIAVDEAIAKATGASHV